MKVRWCGDTPRSVVSEDKAAVISDFVDFSVAAIDYLANGASSFPEERVEVFAAGHVLKSDNFRKTDRP
jgi:hypothetical protein